MKCAVCGKDGINGEYDVCNYCKWTDDAYQKEFPNEDLCANNISLNAAKALFVKGLDKRGNPLLQTKVPSSPPRNVADTARRP